MYPRDDRSESVITNPLAVHAVPAPVLGEQKQFDIRRPASLTENAPLLVIGLAYPVVNVLLLWFGVGSMGMLNVTNFYCFSFGLPILIAITTCLLRLLNVFRFRWWAFDGFLAWISLIGFLNMELFCIAWAAV
jgi:hypothetical protein